MTGMLSPYSTVGFCNAPVTKGLLGATIATSCALNVPQLVSWKRYFIFNFADIFEKQEVWRLFTSHSAFIDVKDLICGAMLMYYFRVFERRYGSRKFSSYLLSTSLLTILLQVLILYGFHLWNFSFTTGYFSTGPIGLIFPLFVSYYFNIPRVAHSHVLGVPITGKTLTYLLGLQMASSSTFTAVTGLSALVAGFMYRYNVLLIQRWLVVPRAVARAVDATLGRLISSPPQSVSVPMGATLEIQRVQHLELLEQQMMQSRMREARRQGRMFPNLFQNDFDELNEGLRQRNAGIAQNNDGENNGNGGEVEVNVSESQVQALMDMGFDRTRVLDALRTSGNDLNIATTLLLQES